MSIKTLSALVPPAMTTAQRNAIPAGGRLPGSVIFNTTTARQEINVGTDATPSWQPIPATTRSTTPPASAQDGDQWIYPGSGFYWLFVYDSTEPTLKWKFVGGGPLYTQNVTALSGTVVGWSYYAGGLTLTLPRAGDYEIVWSCRGQASATAGSTTLGAGPSQNSTTVTFMEATTQAPASNLWAQIGGSAVLLGAAANDIIRMLTYQNSGTVCPFTNRSLIARPIRVI